MDFWHRSDGLASVPKSQLNQPSTWFLPCAFTGPVVVHSCRTTGRMGRQLRTTSQPQHGENSVYCAHVFNLNLLCNLHDWWTIKWGKYNPVLFRQRIPHAGSQRAFFAEHTVDKVASGVPQLAARKCFSTTHGDRPKRVRIPGDFRAMPYWNHLFSTKECYCLQCTFFWTHDHVWCHWILFWSQWVGLIKVSCRYNIIVYICLHCIKSYMHINIIYSMQVGRPLIMILDQH